MRTRRTEPPPRTPEEREAARAERQRRRAARRGEVVPPPAAPFEPDLGIETGVQAVAAEAPITSRRARNTAIFSVLTGLSRVAGLVREIVARSYFGTSGAMSAFTLAFQVPNLIRALLRVRAGVQRAAGEPAPARGAAAGQRARRPAPRGADRALARVHPDRANAHALVHRRRVHAGPRRPRRRAEPGAVPDRRAARPQRPRRRRPERPRALHDPGARAARVEPRDHRW